MIGFAVVFDLLAVFIAQVWLNNQANMRAKSMQAQEKPLATQTIVVAAQPLRFGTELNASMLKEISWSAQALPPGAFHKINDLLAHGRRVVLAAMEADEPVLALKITGPGQRATLSALVRKGRKAVTIRVNDVGGVGGFVLPGDHVDVVLTRQIDKGQATTEVVLQDARVLAIDQIADKRAKIWLASSVGNLSLLLRPAAETADSKTRKITLEDLASNDPVANGKVQTTTVTVTRPKSKEEYTVPVEGKGTLAETAQRSVAR